VEAEGSFQDFGALAANLLQRWQQVNVLSAKDRVLPVW